MAYQPYPINVISTANSTTSNLAGGAAFTGTSEDVSAYAEIRVAVYSSHASAANGLSLQQSTDGTNWDFTDVFTIAATTGQVYSVPVYSQFYRLVYTNGATLTTSLRIETTFHGTAGKASAIRPQDARSNEIDTEEVSAYLMGYNGTTWDRLRSDTTNGLDVDVVRLPALVAGAATIGSIASITTSVVPGTAATNLGKARDSAIGATDTGVAMLGVRRDTPTAETPAAGDYVVPQVSANGEQWVRLAGEIADDAAFTVATTRVVPSGFLADETSTDSVDEGDAGAARMTLDRKQIVTPLAHTNGGATPYMLISAASTNATSLKGSAGQIYAIAAFNLNASPRYLKIYNKATSPTVGTDTPLQVYMIPGNTAGTGLTISFPTGLEFGTGIAFALTTGIATSDTGAVAASEIVVNINYK